MFALGFGSEQPKTIPECFFEQVEKFGPQVCMQMKRRVGSEGDNSVYQRFSSTPEKEESKGGDPLEKPHTHQKPSFFQYTTVEYTWDQFKQKAVLFAKALHQFGIKER